jgi:hypothetical protein
MLMIEDWMVKCATFRFGALNRNAISQKIINIMTKFNIKFAHISQTPTTPTL